MKSFPAKYPGHCSRCGEPFDKGSPITHHEGFYKGSWAHAECPTTKDETADFIADIPEIELPSLNPLAPVEEQEEQEISVAELPVEEANPFREKLSEIEKAISEITSKFGNFESQISKMQERHRETLHKVKDTREEYDVQIQELVKERDDKVNELEDARRALEVDSRRMSSELHQLKREAEKLHASKADILEAIQAEQKLKTLEAKLARIIKDAEWGKTLRDFQREDIIAMYKAWFDGLNGVANFNVMGAGKTLETSAILDIVTPEFISEHGRQPRILWLTKKSLRYSSKEELEQWSPHRKWVVIEGGPEQRRMLLEFALQMPETPGFITNYESMNTTPLIVATDWDFIIVDEVHKLKGGAMSTPTQVWMNARDLLWDTSDDPGVNSNYPNPQKWHQRYRFFMPLSGSPVMNHPKEMWAYLHLFRPDKFPSLYSFERRYVREVRNPKTGEYEPRANIERLMQVLQGQAIRQDPERIWAERPEKQHVDYFVEHTPKQAEIYQSIKSSLFMKLQNMDGEGITLGISSILPMLTYLREANVWPDNISFTHPVEEKEYRLQCGESGKIDQTMELLEEISADNEQAVVWSSQFVGPLYELKRRIDESDLDIRCEIMDGKTVQSGLAQQYEAEFQQGEIQVLLCNRMSVSEGFNFQKNKAKWPGGARHAIFLDLWWNPEGNNQAEDRIWRTGAEEGVVIHRIFVSGSIDEFLMAKNQMKAEMIEEITGNKALRPGQWIDILDGLL